MGGRIGSQSHRFGCAWNASFVAALDVVLTGEGWLPQWGTYELPRPVYHPWTRSGRRRGRKLACYAPPVTKIRVLSCPGGVGPHAAGVRVGGGIHAPGGRASSQRPTPGGGDSCPRGGAGHLGTLAPWHRAPAPPHTLLDHARPPRSAMHSGYRIVICIARNAQSRDLLSR